MHNALTRQVISTAIQRALCNADELYQSGTSIHVGHNPRLFPLAVLNELFGMEKERERDDGAKESKPKLSRIQDYTDIKTQDCTDIET
ncbi:hypothetical protein AV530_002087 [Patagioenas fasciata monilis]|uniref:Uncharacterized protein n=1 Tax=Patagioenas fasciata monilis TaxID=372326 RepID=A0A1V4J792_PATFA|nr:hypothetical protein AV530_002087 [Patagioenas fasciata monilis]